jgi:endoglucanase
MFLPWEKSSSEITSIALSPQEATNSQPGVLVASSSTVVSPVPQTPPKKLEPSTSTTRQSLWTHFLHSSPRYEGALMRIEPCAGMLAHSPFYRDQDMQAKRQYDELRAQGDSRADWLETLACTPQAMWISRALTTDIYGLVDQKMRRADASGTIPVLVVYNAPHQGQYGWGSGLTPGEQYAHWIREVSRAIGTSTAWVILEPDLLGLSFEYSDEDRARAVRDVKYALSVFRSTNPNVRVYLDAGHSDWKPAQVVAPVLRAMGVEDADGFVTNISNFHTTNDELTYASELSDLLGGTHFMIDTGRNGNGPLGRGEWCNPTGRAIGTFPTQNTGIERLDALLWVKNPGESDGTCGGGPGAGVLWIDQAVSMVRKAFELEGRQSIVLSKNSTTAEVR